MGIDRTKTGESTESLRDYQSCCDSASLSGTAAAEKDKQRTKPGAEAGQSNELSLFPRKGQERGLAAPSFSGQAQKSRDTGIDDARNHLPIDTIPTSGVLTAALVTTHFTSPFSFL